MAYRQYTGSRYVPIFGRKGEQSIEWDNSAPYEPLTVVTNQGNSYISRQYVPAGISIMDTTYWAATGNYNAQIESYRQEVLQFDGRISNTEDAIEDITANGWVSTDRIATGAVTHNKIAEDAITSINITNGAIGLVDLNANVQQRILNNNLRYSNVVFIGDSYGRGVGGTDMQGWPYYTAQYLGISDAHMVNVSNSGAGFLAQGHSTGLSGLTFADQIDYAAEHLPEGVTVNDVDYVIVGGGYNDHAQSGLTAAVKNTMNHAKSVFPNAKRFCVPLCVGDRELNAEFNGAYHRIVTGAAQAGAATTEYGIYWLYPYETETSAGDHVHPNDYGYQIEGRNIASFIMGGDIAPYTDVLGATVEGFVIADGATSNGFRCGVNNGLAWASGSFSRKGTGQLCTLPSYLRPLQTTYMEVFFYNDSTHKGIARVSVNPAGIVNVVAADAGTIDADTTYRYYLPYIAIALGHTWQ